MNTKEQNPAPMEHCKGMQKCLCAWLEYFNILNNQFLQGKKRILFMQNGHFSEELCYEKNHSPSKHL